MDELKIRYAGTLEKILGLADELDYSRIGVRAMTGDATTTTREVCKLELGFFLIYIGDGGIFFNNDQTELINLILTGQLGPYSTSAMNEIASKLTIPLAEDNLTFSAFERMDDVLKQKTGIPTTEGTDLIINLYEIFGELMVDYNPNERSRIRYMSYMNGLKARQRRYPH